MFQLCLIIATNGAASPFEYVGKCATNAAWERRCLQAADAVLFTAGSQRDDAIATFPEAEARKCFVVPNGWEPEEHDCARSVQPRSEADRQFVLSYVGTLAEHTLHNAFLDDLASVMQNSEQVRETLRIRFIGKTSPMALDQLQQFKFQENLEHRGMVTKAEALQAMRESSCLLLMNDPRWHRYRQGKLFDYLATDIPILVYGHGGEMAELVTRLDAGVVVRTDRSASLEEAILSMLESRTDTSHSEDDGFREQWLTEHTRSQVTQKMLALFDQILVGKYVFMTQIHFTESTTGRPVQKRFQPRVSVHRLSAWKLVHDPWSPS